LSQKCGKHRSSFEEIVKQMLTRNDFVLEGTDITKYNEYRERMRPPEDAPVQVEVAPQGSGYLLMSKLSAGNQLFADEMTKSMRRSMSMGRAGEGSEGDQALRRYDFTRSSLRK
jgi:hypothetical protein